MMQPSLQEIPVTFLSEANQLVGMLHKGKGSALVILCHGFTGSKTECRRIFVDAGRLYAAEGIDALRFDFFGSGDSAGSFCDSLVSHYIANLADAISWARQRGYEKIAVLGHSMGAATAILTQVQTPVDLLVSWAGVPDMAKTFQAYSIDREAIMIQEEEYIYDGWVIKKAFWEEAMRYDIQAALAQITIPKFFVQGMADAPLFVQGFHAFRTIVQPPADFMEMPAANHLFSHPAHRHQAIWQTLIWLKRHL